MLTPLSHFWRSYWNNMRLTWPPKWIILVERIHRCCVVRLLLSINFQRPHYHHTSQSSWERSLLTQKNLGVGRTEDIYRYLCLLFVLRTFSTTHGFYKLPRIFLHACWFTSPPLLDLVSTCLFTISMTDVFVFKCNSLMCCLLEGT